jgi:hypothetical protein
MHRFYEDIRDLAGILRLAHSDAGVSGGEDTPEKKFPVEPVRLGVVWSVHDVRSHRPGC